MEDVKERLTQLVKLETYNNAESSILYSDSSGNLEFIIVYSVTQNDIPRTSVTVLTHPCLLRLPILSAFLE